MTARQVLVEEDRLKIAELIAKMSDQFLEVKKNKNYFALKVGTGPYSNAVSVRKKEDRVSFFISSTNILNRARAARLDPIAVEPARPCDKNKYKFLKLSFADIQNNESLFREIVRDSVETIIDMKPKSYRK